MALRGTLRDFGLADIFQLIGQQGKSGLLHVRGKEGEVRVSFHEGNVVGAEQTGRRRRDLLGRMLVAAELIREEQLREALDEQRRTLQRLGDILVARGAISRDRLREMTRLQTTETLYRLFTWKSGTYEFEQGPVVWDRWAMTPIRGESLLLEGFRRVDEWPAIRKSIPRDDLVFVPLRPLPGSGGTTRSLEGSGADPVGPRQRRVYALAAPGRTVRELVDLSRLGEFETCKALVDLVAAGFLRPHSAGPRPVSPSSLLARVRNGAGVFAVRLALTVLVLVAAALLFHLRGAIPPRDLRLLPPEPPESASLRLVSGHQLARIRTALGIYRAEHGEYPPTLEPLIEAGLLRDDDLRHPRDRPYHYRRDPGRGFVLHPPPP